MVYSINYDMSSIRSQSYNVFQYIFPLLNSNMSIVELGCGTGRKSIEIAKHVKYIDCVDNNINMLDKAKSKAKEANLTNVRFCLGDNMDVPLQSHSYDICIACLTTWSITEIHRLIKTNGLLFIEVISADDKIEMKKSFGKDEFGWRGRYLNQNKNERFLY